MTIMREVARDKNRSLLSPAGYVKMSALLYIWWPARRAVVMLCLPGEWMSAITNHIACSQVAMRMRRNRYLQMDAHGSHHSSDRLHRIAHYIRPQWGTDRRLICIHQDHVTCQTKITQANVYKNYTKLVQ